MGSRRLLIGFDEFFSRVTQGSLQGFQMFCHVAPKLLNSWSMIKLRFEENETPKTPKP